MKTIYIEHNKEDPESYYIESIPEKHVGPIVNRAIINILKGNAKVTFQ